MGTNDATDLRKIENGGKYAVKGNKFLHLLLLMARQQQQQQKERRRRQQKRRRRQQQEQISSTSKIYLPTKMQQIMI